MNFSQTLALIIELWDEMNWIKRIYCLGSLAFSQFSPVSWEVGEAKLCDIQVLVVSMRSTCLRMATPTPSPHVSGTFFQWGKRIGLSKQRSRKRNVRVNAMNAAVSFWTPRCAIKTA